MDEDERDELLIRLDERTEDMKKDIKSIKVTLFGNGKEGLCYTVQKHKVYFALIASALGVVITFIGLIVDKII